MSTKLTNPKTRDTWIIALLVSIALNGLLVGLLLSKQVNHRPSDNNVTPPPNSVQTMPNNPRHLVRSLSPERHKQVMSSAMRNLKLQGEDQPRKLFKRLRQAKLKTMRLLRADELDMVAVEKSLADIRDINQKLAVSGDALMVEVLGQLTTEERKAAQAAMKQRKNKRQRKPNRR